MEEKSYRRLRPNEAEQLAIKLAVAFESQKLSAPWTISYSSASQEGSTGGRKVGPLWSVRIHLGRTDGYVVDGCFGDYLVNLETGEVIEKRQ